MQIIRFCTRAGAHRCASTRARAAGKFLATFFAAIILSISSGALHAQGCILARSPEQGGLPTNQGGMLQPGHFQLTVGERHQFSYQHYVGDVYQEYRAQDHTQVENLINLLTANLT